MYFDIVVGNKLNWIVLFEKCLWNFEKAKNEICSAYPEPGEKLCGFRMAKLSILIYVHVDINNAAYQFLIMC